MIQGLLNQMDQSYEVTSDSLSVIYEYLFSKQPWGHVEDMNQLSEKSMKKLV